MRQETLFNDNWLFEGRDEIRLPHTAVETPFSYFDEKSYQRAFSYTKTFAYDPAWDGQDVLLRLDAAMANSKVRLNGTEIAAHKDGYTPILAVMTDHLKPGENLIEVDIDGSENPEIPPFGGQIDYLTYAGIYRDAWLIVRPKRAIENIKIETPDPLLAEKSVVLTVFLTDGAFDAGSAHVTAELLNAEGDVLATQDMEAEGDIARLKFEGLKDIALWDIDAPNLYSMRVTLRSAAGEDQVEDRFGFRTVEFTTTGFELNGKPLKIRGLNRHQSFPYMGYALGKAAQEKDAEILKNDLRLNLARTSHYPQSKYFLNKCDEIGLLVFEEIPGWQHIGGEDWKAEAVQNVRRMIERDWNHPSIIIWGVRINESQDDHDFYVQTNNLARDLDPTRQTGGVRYTTSSELLEDVYTMNDFIMGEDEPHLNGPRRALRPQPEVTGLDKPVPYLVTEFNGHMYPTKSTDSEMRLAEHALRHLEVLNAAYGDPNVSGAIGWCAWDYNTHSDFGSGDRICHHGVMDMFREPKFAAFAYTSQSDPKDGVVMKPATYWARGERNIGGVLPLLVMTNCDYVELSYGDLVKVRAYPAREQFPHLPHPPVIITTDNFKEDELGHWGMNWQPGVLKGFIDDKPVTTLNMSANPLPTKLEVAPDATEVEVHEAVRVMVRALDQCGNKLPFMSEPVSVDVKGPARLLGPDVLPLRAGSTGFWVQTTGEGAVELSVSHGRFLPVTQTIVVK